MKKSTLKHKSNRKFVFNKSFLIGLVILAGLAIFGFTYSTFSNPPLIANVMDDYKYNLSQSAAGNVAQNVKDVIKKKNPGLTDAQAQEKAKAEAQITLSNIVVAEKKAAVDSGNTAAAAEADKAAKAIADAQKLNPQNYVVSPSAKAAAQTQVDKDEAQIAADYAKVTGQSATTTTSGASCAGANSGIGNGQWAQTGGALRDAEGKNIPGSHACVQCGGPRSDGKADAGIWGDKQVECGKNEATNYIVRPDQVSELKLPNNCWDNGVWYASNTNLGDKGCTDGKWGAKIVAKPINEEDAGITAQNAERDRMNICNDKKGSWYNGVCYSSESMMNAKKAYDERVAGAAPAVPKASDIYSTKTACETANKGVACILQANSNIEKANQWYAMPNLTVTETTNPTTGRTYAVFNFGNTFKDQASCVSAAGGYAPACVISGNPTSSVKYVLDSTKLPAKVAGYNPATAIAPAAPAAPAAPNTDSTTQTSLKGVAMGGTTLGVVCGLAIASGILTLPAIPGCIVAGAILGGSVGLGVGISNNQTTQPSAPKVETVQPNSVLVPADENKTLVDQYDNLLKVGGTVKTHNNCDGLTECVVKVKGSVSTNFSSSVFIEAADLKKAIEENKPKLDALTKYTQIEAKNPSAFPRTGDGRVYHTKAYCDENKLTCVDTGGFHIYKWVDVNVINAATN